jgi:hypothetical protein
VLVQVGSGDAARAAGRCGALTELFDVGWPASPHRVLRNSTYERWEAAGSPPSGERPEEGEEVASGLLPNLTPCGTTTATVAPALLLSDVSGPLPAGATVGLWQPPSRRVRSRPATHRRILAAPEPGGCLVVVAGVALAVIG